jgi:hypothetical protein
MKRPLIIEEIEHFVNRQGKMPQKARKYAGSGGIPMKQMKRAYAFPNAERCSVEGLARPGCVPLS